ncbi:unnamed protein product [Linum trigynum]|uniref:Uncharacterized protein n=1 Tax=Linum trigynum TaxID=586398 RepID=A0AAV2DC94_9ROSI
MLGASTRTTTHIMRGGASIPTSLGAATPLSHLVSQHQLVAFSRGSPSRLDRGQPHSSSPTSLGRGNHSSSSSASSPSQQQLRLQILR